jgi:peptidyl-prolyl cis-trans isomerase-like 4
LIDDKRIHVDFSQSVSKLHDDVGKKGPLNGLMTRKKYRDEQVEDEYELVFEDSSGSQRIPRQETWKDSKKLKYHRERSRDRDGKHREERGRSIDRYRNERSRDRRERSRDRYKSKRETSRDRYQGRRH